MKSNYKIVDELTISSRHGYFNLTQIEVAPQRRVIIAPDEKKIKWKYYRLSFPYWHIFLISAPDRGVYHYQTIYMGFSSKPHTKNPVLGFTYLPHAEGYYICLGNTDNRPSNADKDKFIKNIMHTFWMSPYSWEGTHPLIGTFSDWEQKSNDSEFYRKVKWAGGFWKRTWCKIFDAPSKKLPLCSKFKKISKIKKIILNEKDHGRLQLQF